MITTALLGEWKLSPFGENFRFSFGSAAFFFFLLWNREIFPVLAGILVGGFVVSFRIALDWVIQGAGFIAESSFWIHFPSFFYYLTFSLLFYIFRLNRLLPQPLWLGILGGGAEIFSNLVELYARFLVTGEIPSLSLINAIIFIAIFRSFFVVGFFNLINWRQAKLAEEKQRQRNEQMLLFISNLYEETVHLKKTLKHVESVTRESYELYRILKEKAAQWNEDQSLAQKALWIAGQVHELKKDNQRIYAGLQEMIAKETSIEHMNVKDLGKIIIRMNQKVSEMLGKKIRFILEVYPDDYHCNIFTTLSIVNNLVVNAVESIDGAGTVKLSIIKVGEWVEWRVWDDGPGIPPKDRDLVFQPGFTSKYDSTGKPSTGIGLSYVKEVVEHLKGTVTIEEPPDSRGTLFLIRLPYHAVVGGSQV
ncbi:sensor histidine kinase [Microaerobacter geothermalis]|uniref:sensor histidine kinase n=1 Tax=Microaerobacter geothermalis TaxID=674972 RepID=UPI001F1DB0FD|nr:sensor histidine kinase [Microaerobacter geothermalis]